MASIVNAMPPPFQTVNDTKPNRTHHVWYEVELNWYKCVLCGGMTRHPSNHAECDRYEKLTDEERNWCMQR